MLIPEIDTARLHLRGFRKDDLDAFSAMVSDPEVMKYFGTGQTASGEEAESALGKIISGWERRGFGRWALIHKEHGRLIGFCGFRLLEGEPELSYMLVKLYWGLGFATEACAACLRYGFEELKFEHIVAVVRDENVASQSVLKKIGMRYKENRRYEDIEAMYFEIRREQYQSKASLK